MAAVLFIVTIPTEAEEQRLKQDILAHTKYDGKSEKAETATLAGISLKSATGVVAAPSINSRTPSTAVLTQTPTATRKTNSSDSNTGGDTGSVSIALEQQQTISVNSDNNTTTNDNNTTPNQFGTFPKRRRKSEYVIKTHEGSSLKSNGIGGSLKSINKIHTPNFLKERLASGQDGSGKTKSIKKKEPTPDMELTYDTCMETVLRVILKRCQISNAMWAKDENGRMYQVSFTVEFNEIYEKILDDFNEWGIGDREGSSVSVMNCIASKAFSTKDEDDEDNDENADNYDKKQSAWERFMNSVRSRLNVTQIVRNVREDASITFDFVVLLISAAVLAAFGLIENSTIFLASSMLVSPLMGPIIATIFGTVIKDKSLFRLGMINELFGICTAVLVGFIFGIVVCTTDERYSIGEGLTDEILSRCELHSLIVGVFTAIPSGAAAAIGILGGNIGSLVGVAISASLLPPAVNSGLLWAIALIYKCYENDESKFPQVVKTTQYSENQANELAVLATISMCLTISNILCIYVMGILVLKLKEIAPVSGTNREFWKHDIKIARHLKRRRLDSDNVIMDEYAHLPQEDQKALGINYDMLRTIQMDDAAYQNTWSPVGTRHPFETSYEPMRGNYSTVHQIDQLYATITHQTTMKEKMHRFGLGRRPTGRMVDFASSYKLLSENLPRSRCSTMPSKVNPPTVKIVTPDSSQFNSCTNTPSMAAEKNRRKFIVTPAEDDPLQPLNPSDA
ncbi:uncharacterized protein LOC101897717 isoform X1 [Musca domestica]|uniref:Uncharacterized protein LOC101897717 n=1 Tax=Musca domestica TaxID=7370 RepID=A0A1I8MCT9_MUSDO|nr:uncharacterized protein LOC101897717 isoform X1 [Musca domestica]